MAPTKEQEIKFLEAILHGQDGYQMDEFYFHHLNKFMEGIKDQRHAGFRIKHSIDSVVYEDVYVATGDGRFQRTRFHVPKEGESSPADFRPVGETLLLTVTQVEERLPLSGFTFSLPAGGLLQADQQRQALEAQLKTLQAEIPSSAKVEEAAAVKPEAPKTEAVKADPPKAEMPPEEMAKPQPAQPEPVKPAEPAPAVIVEEKVILRAPALADALRDALAPEAEKKAGELPDIKDAVLAKPLNVRERINIRLGDNLRHEALQNPVTLVEPVMVRKLNWGKLKNILLSIADSAEQGGQTIVQVHDRFYQIQPEKTGKKFVELRPLDKIDEDFGFSRKLPDINSVSAAINLFQKNILAKPQALSADELIEVIRDAKKGRLDLTVAVKTKNSSVAFSQPVQDAVADLGGRFPAPVVGAKAKAKARMPVAAADKTVQPAPEAEIAAAPAAAVLPSLAEALHKILKDNLPPRAPLTLDIPDIKAPPMPAMQMEQTGTLPYALGTKEGLTFSDDADEGLEDALPALKDLAREAARYKGASFICRIKDEDDKVFRANYTSRGDGKFDVETSDKKKFFDDVSLSQLQKTKIFKKAAEVRVRIDADNAANAELKKSLAAPAASDGVDLPSASYEALIKAVEERGQSPARTQIAISDRADPNNPWLFVVGGGKFQRVFEDDKKNLVLGKNFGNAKAMLSGSSNFSLTEENFDGFKKHGLIIKAKPVPAGKVFKENPTLASLIEEMERKPAGSVQFAGTQQEAAKFAKAHDEQLRQAAKPHTDYGNEARKAQKAKANSYSMTA